MRRRKVPVKIIAANRAAEYKTCQGKGKGEGKKQAGLVSHQYGANGNKQAAEYKKVECFFQEQLKLFQEYGVRFDIGAFISGLVRSDHADPEIHIGTLNKADVLHIVPEFTIGELGLQLDLVLFGEIEIHGSG